MAQKPLEGWIVEEEPTDLPAPEPAPSDWVKPAAPVETEIEAQPGIEVETEERDLEAHRRSKRRRLSITSVVFLVLAVLVLLTSEGGFASVLLFVVPLYLLCLPFVLRTPKRLRGRKPALADRMGFASKLMTTVAVFLAVYLPFTFFTNSIIPYAALVEYVLFAFLLFLLLRLGARTVGIAPSIEALPPPSHRLHQQVIAPIDDAHYQRTLWLNFSFVEKARGGRGLAKRLDEVLASNGVAPERRTALLAELHTVDDEGGLRLLGRSRERRASDRQRRVQVLDRLFDNLNRELENRA